MTSRTSPQPQAAAAPAQLRLTRQTLRNLDARPGRAVGIRPPVTTCCPCTPCGFNS
jgi:hypothetical protein